MKNNKIDAIIVLGNSKQEICVGLQRASEFVNQADQIEVVGHGRDAVLSQQDTRALGGAVRLAVGAVPHGHQYRRKRPLTRRPIHISRQRRSIAQRNNEIAFDNNFRMSIRFHNGSPYVSRSSIRTEHAAKASCSDRRAE